MIGCFRTFDKAKWFIDFKNENNTDSEYKYEIQQIHLTKDAVDYLFFIERPCLTPTYKDTLTIQNILKYPGKLQNIEKIFSED